MMKFLPIRAYGDPILQKKTKPVSGNSAELQEFIDAMIHTMIRAHGAGLAAPQVGKSLRIFVADLSGALQSMPERERPAIPNQPIVCINPEIIFSSREEVEFEEGCLSVPNVPVTIKRPYQVKLRYTDRNFKRCEMEGTGPISSVLQHENDHLNGVLHIDHLSRFRKKLVENSLKMIENGIFEADYPMQIGD
jgi:peptide deformylase